MLANIKFKIESELQKEYAWIISVFAKYIGFNCEFVIEGEDILVAEHGMGDMQVSHFFRNTYQSGDFHFKGYFRKEPLHTNASGKPDYLSTCFYLLSYLQEYIDYTPDKYDRFPYDISLQKHFNCIDQNLVAQYFDALYESTHKLKSLVKKQERPTLYFLTHDIDSVYGALGDNYGYLVKHGKIGALLQLIFNHYIKTPDYLLLNKILDIEDAFDVRSTFFWLVNSGKGTRRINNADYEIDAPSIKRMRSEIIAKGWENGLHKSAGKDNFTNELKKQGELGSPINRNHYLITELPNTFDDIENSGIKLDSSMGFPDVMGFRNNYGLPIKPFHLKEKRAYNFVEVPLNVMDTSLKYYQNCNSKQAGKKILDFLEKNKTNALLTILWHNNYFFDQADKGWLELYKTILQFIKENGGEVTTGKNIIRDFSS